MITAYLVIVVFLFSGVNFEKGSSKYKRSLTMDKAPFATVVFSNKNKFFCSGTLVHLEYVLTAAHCLYDMHGTLTEDDTSVTVMAGSEKVKFDENEVATGKVQLRGSKRIMIHHGYTWSENFVKDLAIIHVRTPFNKTEHVDVAPLQKSNATKKMQTREYPWNITDFHSLRRHEVGTWVSHICDGYWYGDSPHQIESHMGNIIREHTITVMKHCYCLEKVRSLRSPFNIIKVKNIFLCDNLGTPVNLCCGDNGGTLLCNNMLRGIATTVFHYKSHDDESCVTHTTHDCCHPQEEKPHPCGGGMSMSVFTDLCYFSEWLYQHIPGYPLTDQHCKPVGKSSVMLGRSDIDY
ncbi:venom plasminogen activator-like [Homalodisca vitripennis]|uniref:venom plasminogen activator-like n=1 Tax=Homalodisca vitripennis TaxID=197043 RepID=UPI001EEC991E|nr:venom plasminogen activator-like [Homalodisca vitripennis]